jgi:CHAD domain-containing protein
MSETLAAALAELAAAREGQEVHEARRQIKRARALLRLAKPALGEHNFSAANRHLKEAADRLAGARRAEAMLEAINQLGPRSRRPSPAVTALVGAAKTACQNTANVAHREPTVTEAGIAIAAVQALLNTISLPDRGHKPYLKAFRQTYGKARRKLMQGLASGDGETLHEARKSAIHHLHHLEFLAPLWPKLFETWVAEAHNLRQALGDLHDLAELQALLAETGSPYAEIAEKDEALALIKRRRKRLLQRIRNRQPQLFAEPPKALARRIEAMWREGAGNPGQGRNGR